MCGRSERVNSDVVEQRASIVRVSARTRQGERKGGQSQSVGGCTQAAAMSLIASELPPRHSAAAAAAHPLRRHSQSRLSRSARRRGAQSLVGPAVVGFSANNQRRTTPAAPPSAAVVESTDYLQQPDCDRRRPADRQRAAAESVRPSTRYVSAAAAATDQ